MYVVYISMAFFIFSLGLYVYSEILTNLTCLKSAMITYILWYYVGTTT